MAVTTPRAQPAVPSTRSTPGIARFPSPAALHRPRIRPTLHEVDHFQPVSRPSRVSANRRAARGRRCAPPPRCAGPAPGRPRRSDTVAPAGTWCGSPLSTTSRKAVVVSTRLLIQQVMAAVRGTAVRVPGDPLIFLYSRCFSSARPIALTALMISAEVPRPTWGMSKPSASTPLVVGAAGGEHARLDHGRDHPHRDLGAGDRLAALAGAGAQDQRRAGRRAPGRAPPPAGGRAAPGRPRWSGTRGSPGRASAPARSAGPAAATAGRRDRLERGRRRSPGPRRRPRRARQRLAGDAAARQVSPASRRARHGGVAGIGMRHRRRRPPSGSDESAAPAGRRRRADHRMLARSGGWRRARRAWRRACRGGSPRSSSGAGGP